MDDLIIFIIRLFTAAFYTLVFFGVLAVAALIVYLAETRERGRKE